MVLPLASIMEGQLKLSIVHMLSTDNFQPLFTKIMKNKLHLQPWKWPWKKLRIDYAFWMLFSSRDSGASHTTVPHLNKVVYPQNRPRLRSGFGMKAKGTVVILPQHHLPRAPLTLYRG